LFRFTEFSVALYVKKVTEGSKKVTEGLIFDQTMRGYTGQDFSAAIRRDFLSIENAQKLIPPSPFSAHQPIRLATDCGPGGVTLAYEQTKHGNADSRKRGPLSVASPRREHEPPDANQDIRNTGRGD